MTAVMDNKNMYNLELYVEVPFANIIGPLHLLLVGLYESGMSESIEN